MYAVLLHVQARDAHLELMGSPRPVRPQLIVASPLSRAIETAQLVFPQETGGHSDIFFSLESLRERNGLLLTAQRRSVAYPLFVGLVKIVCTHIHSEPDR